MADFPPVTPSRRPPRRPDEDWLETYRGLTRDNPFMDPLAELGMLYARPTNTVNMPNSREAVPKARTRTSRADGGITEVGMTANLRNPYVMAHELRHAGLSALRHYAMQGEFGDMGYETLAPFMEGGDAEEFLIELLDAPTKYGTREVPRGGLTGALFGGTNAETYNIPLERYGQEVRDWYERNGQAAVDYMRADTGRDMTADEIAAMLYGEEHEEGDPEVIEAARSRAAQILDMARRAPGMGF